jgi:Cof subfamily protein (haloacid dehalogenase superfamily)
MPIRLVAIDLDGTLLNSRREISEGNRQAILQAVEGGVQVVIVTGRRFHSALPLVSQIPCLVNLITSNGALISNSSGEVLHRDFLPRQVAQQVFEAVREYRPYSVAIFNTPGYGQVTMQDNAAGDGPLGWYTQNSPHCLRLVPDLEAALETDPIQVMIGGPPARIEPAEAILEKAPIRPSIHVTWTKYLTTNISILDVLNQGCSKGRALKIWAEHCGIEPGEIMAVGDNFNDLEMLQYAGLPILMGNHCPELHRPEWTLTLPNDEDGVAAAIRSHVLKTGC